VSDFEATIVIPCRHEEGNVGPLIKRLGAALDGRRCELIFVDDSDDSRTVQAIHAAAAASRIVHSGLDIVVFHRCGEQRWGGLAGAVIDGFRRARSANAVVMDSDLQHPPELVPTLLDRLGDGREGDGGDGDGGDGGDGDGAELVMASRYRAGGSAGGLSGPVRHLVSRASTLLAKASFPVVLRGVSDPMTGFFALRLDLVDLGELRSRGFKILLEILARYPRLRRDEVALRFERRFSGDSKGEARQGLEYVKQLARLRFATAGGKRVGHFAFGGALAAVAGVVLLGLLVRAGVDQRLAFALQLGATLVLNFGYSYAVTWRDRRRAGIRRQVGWFLATRGATQALSWLAFAALVGIGWHYQAANGACLGFAMVLNYYTADRLVFHNGRSRRRLGWLVLGALLIGVAAGLYAWHPTVSAALAVGLLAVALFNAAIGGLEVRWRLYGWRTPQVVEQMKWPAPSGPGEATETFSLIVPALHEAKVIAGTLHRLLEQDYEHYEIVVSLCAGDEETIAEVRRVIRDDDPYRRIRTVIRSYQKSNKPRQLNAALAECTGTVVGVVDAEDDVAPGLLPRVDALLRRSGADVVQGGVQLTTLGRRAGDWFKVHNVLEYFFWFTSRMFYQVRCGFVPLGGNTVFIRRELMVRAGGWPDNLTEDCALGVLLCTRYGAKVVAAYEPELATREEVPPTIADRARGSLFWQRVRWNQGFLSVLLEGEWLTLPTLRQRVLAWYVLATPFLQAFSGLLLPLSIATILFLKVPVAVVMLMYAPFLPILITLTSQLIGLHEFARAYRQRIGLRHYAFLLFGAPFYQWILMAAALWAVVQHVQGNTTWHKTAHGGLHREPAGQHAPLRPQLAEA
jgi:cellulose synthase/poly-beta-1,6-N-acetylglucosamine synthase-like glycosyltransferase/putative flippase GtrA